MSSRFVRALDPGGVEPALTRAQQEAWDTKCGFVGHLMPLGQAMSFHEVVLACEALAKRRREEPLLPEAVALQLVDLLEQDFVRLVPEPKGRRRARGTQT